jgi:hypothetical protein
MDLSAHGIHATIEPDGTLDLKVGHPLKIRLNGLLLNGGPASAPQAIPPQKFWQPDGTQGDITVDLRGEVR